MPNGEADYFRSLIESINLNFSAKKVRISLNDFDDCIIKEMLVYLVFCKLAN